MKKTITCLIVLFLIPFYFNAQNRVTTPTRVDLMSDPTVVPPVFFLVKNSYEFLCLEEIDSLKFISSNQFQITRDSANVFTISKQALALDQYEVPNDLQVEAIGKNGSIWKFEIPVKLCPGIIIEFMTYSGKWFPNADSVYVAENFHCKAQWDYPEYVSACNYPHRYRGVFEVDLMHAGVRLDGRTGWYDSGDMTQLMEIPELPSGTMLEVVIKESGLLTLAFDQFPDGFRKTKVMLSDRAPRRIKLRIP